MTTIFLAGATGLVGHEALARLLADDRVTQVVAPTRRPVVPHPKLFNPIIENTILPLDAAWWAVDGAICAIGTTRAKTPSAADYRAIDHDYVLAIAEQVRKCGATRFALTSSMGASARSYFRYTRIKGELEDAVTNLDFGSLTIVRPGFLGGERSEVRMMERVMGSVLRVAAPVLPVAVRINPATTVAAFLVEAAIGGNRGKHIIVSADIAKAAERSRRR
jgi:uncharacterized protein YbjT (DUF2867 family)